MSSYETERLPIPTPRRLKAELRLPPAPFWMKSALLIALAAGLAFLAWVVKARVSTSDQPRLQILQDMGNQPRYSAQQPSAVFADGRAMRPPVPGTVARGMLSADDHYERGYVLVPKPDGSNEVKYFAGLPAAVTLNDRLLRRGQVVFDTYCATCHGHDGYGNGPINQRATERQEPKWVPPANLHTPDVRGRADGHLYNTIRNGIRNMPPYGSQIQTADRWAVVAYLRALQRSQNAKVDDVPPEEQAKLR